MGTDKPPGNRHVYGPRPMGALVPAITRPAFKVRSPAGAQIMADWAGIIGPELAAVTAPRRLTGGTLTLACAGPVALELQHLSGPLLERVNAYLGRVAVQRLRVVQDMAVAPAARARRKQAPPAPVDVPGLPPGPLRDALAALGGRLARRPAPDPA